MMTDCIDYFQLHSSRLARNPTAHPHKRKPLYSMSAKLYPFPGNLQWNQILSAYKSVASLNNRLVLLLPQIMVTTKSICPIARLDFHQLKVLTSSCLKHFYLRRFLQLQERVSSKISLRNNFSNDRLKSQPIKCIRFFELANEMVPLERMNGLFVSLSS